MVQAGNDRNSNIEIRNKFFRVSRKGGMICLTEIGRVAAPLPLQISASAAIVEIRMFASVGRGRCPPAVSSAIARGRAFKRPTSHPTIPSRRGQRPYSLHDFQRRPGVSFGINSALDPPLLLVIHGNLRSGLCSAGGQSANEMMAVAAKRRLRRDLQPDWFDAGLPYSPFMKRIDAPWGWRSTFNQAQEKPPCRVS